MLQPSLSSADGFADNASSSLGFAGSRMLQPQQLDGGRSSLLSLGCCVRSPLKGALSSSFFKHPWLLLDPPCTETRRRRRSSRAIISVEDCDIGQSGHVLQLLGELREVLSDERPDDFLPQLQPGPLA